MNISRLLHNKQSLHQSTEQRMRLLREQSLIQEEIDELSHSVNDSSKQIEATRAQLATINATEQPSAEVRPKPRISNGYSLSEAVKPDWPNRAWLPPRPRPKSEILRSPLKCATAEIRPNTNVNNDSNNSNAENAIDNVHVDTTGMTSSNIGVGSGCTGEDDQSQVANVSSRSNNTIPLLKTVNHPTGSTENENQAIEESENSTQPPIISSSGSTQSVFHNMQSLNTSNECPPATDLSLRDGSNSDHFLSSKASSSSSATLSLPGSTPSSPPTLARSEHESIHSHRTQQEEQLNSLSNTELGGDDERPFLGFARPAADKVKVAISEIGQSEQSEEECKELQFDLNYFCAVHPDTRIKRINLSKHNAANKSLDRNSRSIDLSNTRKLSDYYNCFMSNNR